MAPQGRRETLEMWGDRVHLALLGSLAPLGLLVKGVLLVAWVKKVEKERKVPRGNQVLMDPQASKKKRLAMDSSKVLLQKVDGSLKSFRSQPLQKTLTPNTLILGPGNTGLPGSTWLGSPHQSCFCAVTKRVLWTGQGAGGARRRQS